MTVTAVMPLATEVEATVAAAALMQTELIVTGTHTQTVEEAPPAPYTTVTLLEDATTRLNWDSSKVMAIAQSLFEGIELGGAHAGLITYHRTDSIHVAPEAQVAARAMIARLYGQAALPPRAPTVDRQPLTVDPVERSSMSWLSRLKAILPFLRHTPHVAPRTSHAQEAHEAIRPTVVSRLPDSLRTYLSDDQSSLYRLIWERFVASQMRAARYRVTIVELEGESEL